MGEIVQFPGGPDEEADAEYINRWQEWVGSLSPAERDQLMSEIEGAKHRHPSSGTDPE